MRIAFIVNNFPCLSQTFILNQITGLIDRGHDVDIYANGPDSDAKVHPDVEKYNLLSSTYYFDVPPVRIARILKSIGLMLSNRHQHPEVLRATLRSFIFRKNVVWSQWMIPYLAIPILDNQLEGRAYDVIHCHFGPCGLKGAQLKLLNLLKGKLITTFHGYDLTSFLQSQNKKISRKWSRKLFKSKPVYDHLFTAGDEFLPISEHWQQRLLQLGCNPEKTSVHRMGIDVKTFAFTPRRLFAGESIKVLTIARLVEKKGVEYGIRAIAKLIAMNPNTEHTIEYNIVGDGPLKAELISLIDELKVAQHVRLLGWKQQDEIVECLASSHLILAPSVTSKTGDQEGIPVVLMEAMAMGLPVMSTYHSGIPELVEEDVSGYLVPERDVAALTDKLGYLVNHPERWSEMGKAGRLCVENHYNIDKLNVQLVDIYQKR